MESSYIWRLSDCVDEAKHLVCSGGFVLHNIFQEVNNIKRWRPMAIACYLWLFRLQFACTFCW